MPYQIFVSQKNKNQFKISELKPNILVKVVNSVNVSSLIWNSGEVLIRITQKERTISDAIVSLTTGNVITGIQLDNVLKSALVVESMDQGTEVRLKTL